MPLTIEQTHLDYLVPAGRTKFRLTEVASILGADGHAVSVRAVREAMESGQLGGNRLPFSAKPGSEERFKVEWVTADDLRLYILRTRTLEPRDHVARVLALVDKLPRAALDALIQRAMEARAKARI